MADLSKTLYVCHSIKMTKINSKKNDETSKIHKNETIQIESSLRNLSSKTVTLKVHLVGYTKLNTINSTHTK